MKEWRHVALKRWRHATVVGQPRLQKIQRAPCLDLPTKLGVLPISSDPPKRKTPKRGETEGEANPEEINVVLIQAQEEVSESNLALFQARGCQEWRNPQISNNPHHLPNPLMKEWRHMALQRWRHAEVVGQPRLQKIQRAPSLDLPTKLVMEIIHTSSPIP